MKEKDNRGSLVVKDCVKFYGKRAVVDRVNLAVNICPSNSKLKAPTSGRFHSSAFLLDEGSCISWRSGLSPFSHILRKWS